MHQVEPSQSPVNLPGGAPTSKKEFIWKVKYTQCGGEVEWGEPRGRGRVWIRNVTNICSSVMQLAARRRGGLAVLWNGPSPSTFQAAHGGQARTCCTRTRQSAHPSTGAHESSTMPQNTKHAVFTRPFLRSKESPFMPFYRWCIAHALMHLCNTSMAPPSRGSVPGKSGSSSPAPAAKRKKKKKKPRLPITCSGLSQHRRDGALQIWAAEEQEVEQTRRQNWIRKHSENRAIFRPV